MLVCYNNTKRSITSMMDICEEKAVEVEEVLVMGDIAIEKDLKEIADDQEEEGSKSSIVWCQRHNGNGWHCKERAKQGYSFCDHHLHLNKSRYKTDTNNNGNSSEVLAAGAWCAREKAKRGSSSNPHEFIYYSGFGPSWRRKRGNRDKEQAKMGESRITTTRPTHQITPPSSSSEIANEEFDYVDEDDEDGADNGSGANGRKKMRKPVKARSLKSLM